MVKVNGIELDLTGNTVLEYLTAAGYDPLRVAVERNGDIVSRTTYGETILQDGDTLEVVRFVGGG